MTNYNRNGLNTNINVKREHKQQYEHKHEQKICDSQQKQTKKQGTNLMKPYLKLALIKLTTLDFIPGNHN